MHRVDEIVTGAEFVKLLKSFKTAEADGSIDENIQRMRQEFSWKQSKDFYQGFTRALLLGADLFRANPTTDRALLGASLLLLAGIALSHLAGEDERPKLRMF
jgi:hypothetical protein